jgi:hypothetical protein
MSGYPKGIGLDDAEHPATLQSVSGSQDSFFYSLSDDSSFFYSPQ